MAPMPIQAQAAPAPVELDEKKQMAFAQKVGGSFAGASLIFNITTGLETGLIAAMNKLEGPATSQEIADLADCNERYTREWLAAMTTGGAIERTEDNKYFMPREHQELIHSDTEKPMNMAYLARMLAMFGRHAPKVYPYFKNGGGLPYAEIPEFHEIIQKMNEGLALRMPTYFLPTYVPQIHELLTRGGDVKVADCGCGAGMTTLNMARNYPKSEFIGLDLCPDALARAEKNKSERFSGLDNVKFQQMDLTDMTANGEYDFMFVLDAVHDQRRPDLFFKNAHRALKPGGVLFFVDINASSFVQNNMENPFASFFYTASCYHCMTVSLAYGGQGNGTCMGVEKYEQLCREAGFNDIKQHTDPAAPVNVFFACTKDA
eukprot:Clim_evm12s250 gene=Clim_evmTU12s250